MTARGVFRDSPARLIERSTEYMPEGAVMTR
jgi:hypothetical protein